MTGYRPDFYNDDPRLHTIEILAWIAARDSFTIGELREEFSSDLKDYGDPDHEASERLRKLLKSEMILIVTPGLVKTFETTKIHRPKLIEYLEERLSQIASIKKPGRKPRLYMATEAGRKYVETRKADLEKI